MQHYGLKTRLLDWTDSVLTAAYFAVSDHGHSDHDAVIWALSPELLNLAETDHEGVLGMDHPLTRRSIRLAFEDADSPGAFDSTCLALDPHQVDPRMMVQHASFTIHGDQHPLDKHPRAHEFLARIRIPARLKPHIMGVLNFSGVRESTVFPDLGHLANELNMARNKEDIWPENPKED
jgi:hypothetical protein